MCKSAGKFRWFYTGNQVGWQNYTGLLNFVAGGPAGSSIAAGRLSKLFFPTEPNRALWENDDAVLNQDLLDASYPFIELNCIVDIILKSTTFRVSNKNIYVQDDDGTPRFYEARLDKAPSVSITLGEWLNPQFQIGDIQLKLNNRDGKFNKYLPQGAEATGWTGAKIIVKVGFGEKISNYFQTFSGSVTDKKGVQTTDETIAISAYDAYNDDDKELPPNIYSLDSFPDMQSDYVNKGIPLVYGDWTIDVGLYGEIPAVCVNQFEADPTSSVFKISDNQLEEVQDVWLYRGDRVEGKPGGPIKFLDSAITKDVINGQVIIPTTGRVLSGYYDIVVRGSAGPGTSSTVITANNDTLNFVALGVKEGDIVTNATAIAATLTINGMQYKAVDPGVGGNSITVSYVAIPFTLVPDPNSPDPDFPNMIKQYSFNEFAELTSPTAVLVHIKEGDSKPKDINDALTKKPEIRAIITFGSSGAETTQFAMAPTALSGGQSGSASASIIGVSPSSIQLDGSITFAEKDSYSVSTNQYSFVKGDKITVKVKGKDIRNLSVTRLLDAGLGTSQPTCLTVGLDGTYWTADDSVQKIYHVDFHNHIIKTLNYSDISSDITKITGMSIQTDNTLWLFDQPLSKVYRYIIDQEGLGLSFQTSEVHGLDINLTQGVGLTIDTDNHLYIVDNATLTFYKFDPFNPSFPLLITTWTSAAFIFTTPDITSMCVDSINQNIAVCDRVTKKIYRINRSTGGLISSFPFSSFSDDADLISGLSTAQDDTIFILDRSTMSIYNYNEFVDCNNNPGFIARDIIQKYTNKVATDFDLRWNQTSRRDLSKYQCRAYIIDKTTIIKYVNSLLQQFNTSLYFQFGKYALFHMTFANFDQNGHVIREGDIKLGSFHPSKEYNQYFNKVSGDYQHLPFSSKKIPSDNYISVSGVTAAEKEIPRTVDCPNLFRRTDVDKLFPLIVRLAAAEPEFIEVVVGWRFLFTQLNQFFLLNYDAPVDLITGQKVGGRRFNNVPCFVRQIDIDHETMEIKLKLWSLGTTQFGTYVPSGPKIGGEKDPIVLTTLGTVGYVSPTGIITSATTSALTIEKFQGTIAAEVRGKPVVGKAWLPNYVIAIVDASTHAVVETGVIQSVSGDVITLTSNLSIVPSSSVKNSAGFVTSGHYVRYANYTDVMPDQKKYFAYFTKPTANYPSNAATEVAEQRAGLHNFDDGRIPYVLFSKDYVPS
jgi:hypothetical protein